MKINKLLTTLLVPFMLTGCGNPSEISKVDAINKANSILDHYESDGFKLPDETKFHMHFNESYNPVTKKFDNVTVNDIEFCASKLFAHSIVHYIGVNVDEETKVGTPYDTISEIYCVADDPDEPTTVFLLKKNTDNLDAKNNYIDKIVADVDDPEARAMVDFAYEGMDPFSQTSQFYFTFVSALVDISRMDPEDDGRQTLPDGTISVDPTVTKYFSEGEGHFKFQANIDIREKVGETICEFKDNLPCSYKTSVQSFIDPFDSSVTEFDYKYEKEVTYSYGGLNYQIPKEFADLMTNKE